MIVPPSEIAMKDTSPDLARTQGLLANVAVVAACALLYELTLATVASYILGDAVVQFSLILGTYLASMGLGAAVSRAIGDDAARWYVRAEIALACAGAASVPLLFWLSPHRGAFRVGLYGEVALIGSLVGLELPLLLRLLGEGVGLRESASGALSLDYAGSLLACLLFPIVCVPTLGLLRTSLLTGLTNAIVAWWAIGLLRADLTRAARITLRAAALATGLSLVVALAFHARLEQLAGN